ESTFEHAYPPSAPQFNDKVPASTTAYKGATALKFNYTSDENGNWQVVIYRNDWSAVDISEMDTLSFYIYSETELPAIALPLIAVRALNVNESGDLNSSLFPLSDYNNDIPAEEWVRVTFPLKVLFDHDESLSLNFKKTKGVVFNQSELNGKTRLILIDEISTFKKLDSIPVVSNLTAIGYDSHTELSWNLPLDQLSYRVYASYDGGLNYELRFETTESIFLDFVPDSARNLKVHYRVMSVFQGQESEPVEISAELKDFTDDELLEMVQQYTFRYFWEGAHQSTGMILERSNGNPATVASGATGMGLMAMVVASEHQYKPREEIQNRILQILNFLETCERYHGAWSHWYDANTGLTQPFSPDDDGGDLVETSFVATALIALRNYFTGTDLKSIEIRETATRLWETIDWDWYRNNQEVLFWHWSPNIGFEKNMPISGWNETLITYIMAASSPTYGIPAEVYHQGFARDGKIVNPRTFYGFEIKLAPDWGGPLFWIHYSHLGINPKGLADQYANYWEEYVNTASIHNAYAADNPLNHDNYSDSNWGLTASDDPEGYTAHQPMSNDNGTISPTAAISSIPYTPEASLKALKYFYRTRGNQLFGRYGFYDAYNDNYNWVQDAYLGIDQGPIIIMIENFRTGLLWEVVMKDADIQSGLEKLGFTYEIISSEPHLSEHQNLTIYPNPASDEVWIQFSVVHSNRLSDITIFNVDGRLIKALKVQQESGKLSFSTADLKDGLYVLQVREKDVIFKTTLVIKQ
ncbi:MAG TPA: glucoamylase family protein, partial [Mariniphaga sp.]|nr:glucoamylase family protein [Mariniphaga sp.]